MVFEMRGTFGRIDPTMLVLSSLAQLSDAREEQNPGLGYKF